MSILQLFYCLTKSGRVCKSTLFLAIMWGRTQRSEVAFYDAIKPWNTPKEQVEPQVVFLFGGLG